MGRLSAQKKVERDRQVVADRQRGLTWPTVAERHSLSERHCRQIVAQWRSSRPGLAELDPLELAQEALDRQETLVEEYALLSETSRHDAVRLGALKAKHAALNDHTSLLIACGLLPRLGRVAVEIDVRRLTQHILSVFDRHGVDQAARRDLVEVLRGGTSPARWNGPDANPNGVSASARRGDQPGRVICPGQVIPLTHRWHALCDEEVRAQGGSHDVADDRREDSGRRAHGTWTRGRSLGGGCNRFGGSLRPRRQARSGEGFGFTVGGLARRPAGFIGDRSRLLGLGQFLRVAHDGRRPGGA